MTETTNVLNSFESITLGELDKLDFYDRYDSKSVFNQNFLNKFLQQLSGLYRVLDIEGVRIFRYESHYFDTPDLLCYNAHQRGKAVRHKLRYRRYVDSSATFFEIKSKDNKGRSHKARSKVEKVYETFPPELREAIARATNISTDTLGATLKVALNRITLVHKNLEEKVTFDFDIKFKLDGSEKVFNDLVIAELKQKRFNSHSDFLRIQRQFRIRPMAISKYCLGMASLSNDVKINRFKPGLRRLKKITS